MILRKISKNITTISINPVVISVYMGMPCDWVSPLTGHHGSCTCKWLLVMLPIRCVPHKGITCK
jgi:hypothetical protein